VTKSFKRVKPKTAEHKNKYVKPPEKRVATGFCDPPKWIIVRFDKTRKQWSVERHIETREVYYWTTKQAADQSLGAMKLDSQRIREVRRMYTDELLQFGKNLQLVTPKPVTAKPEEPNPIETEVKTMAKTRVRSTGCLVEIFEDLETRKFAISTTASNEGEFITEFAQAIAAAPTTDWNTRMKEFLPLVVDLCCKFRGYKADRVQERRELVAGDLEIPS